MSRTTGQVLLARRPEGIPQRAHFRIVEDLVSPLRARKALVRNEWLSVEPAIHGWVNAVGIGESNVPGWPVGTPVAGLSGWQEHAVVGPDAIAGLYRAENLGKRPVLLHHQPA
jgi:NADPH-dependent curcumin reductase CurA